MFIGNDIVSIKHAVENKHFLTQRYLNKLFTPKEQRYICSSNMLAYAAWLIWTAKESAYKIYNKQSGKRMYYPKKFEVTVSDNQLVPYIRSLKTNNTKEMQALTSSGVLLSGRVRTPLKNVFVSFFPTHDFIHTLAAENNAHLKNIRWGIASISSIKYKSQSSQVRLLTKERIAKEIGINPSTLTINRQFRNDRSGPPCIYYEGRKLKIDISITHDADLVAYAYL